MCCAGDVDEGQLGGVLQFVNAYGFNEFIARTEELAERFGPRFAPPALLIKMAKNNETFTD